MTPRDEYLRAVRIPLDQLKATYDEVVATGSQRAVAIAHGWNQAKVRHRVLSYMRHAGIEGDPPGIVSRDHAQRGSLSHSGVGDRSIINGLREELRTARAPGRRARGGERHPPRDAGGVPGRARLLPCRPPEARPADGPRRAPGPPPQPATIRPEGSMSTGRATPTGPVHVVIAGRAICCGSLATLPAGDAPPCAQCARTVARRARAGR